MPHETSHPIAKPLGDDDDVPQAVTQSEKANGIRKNYLICVGVGAYKNTDLNLGTCCANDCNGLIKILTSDYSFETVTGTYDSGGNKINDDPLVLLNERATRSAIENLFDSLCYHPDFQILPDDLPAHNLIIYYSGHGSTVKKSGKDFFYWVPHDYDGSVAQPDSKRLYSLFFNLVNSILDIRYHSLIIISDSCHSAATFELTNWFTPSLQATPGTDPKAEQSLWAICSSASNQLSYADGEYSFFTRHLLDALENNLEPELNIETLGIELKEMLLLSNQRVFPGRLGLIPNNTGNFYFTGNATKKEKLNKKERWKKLQDDLYKLNYKDQKDKLEDWRRRLDKVAQRFFICISAVPDYGLKLAHHHIARSQFFPVKYASNQKSPCLLNTHQSLAATDDFVMNLLCKELDLVPTIDKDNLNKQIQNKLQTAPVILEMIIDPESITVSMKKQLVKKIHDVLSGFLLPVENGFPFFILLIDSDGTDYNGVVGELPAKEVVKFVMPPVTDVDDWVLKRWLNEVRGVSDEQKEQYDKLFENILDNIRTEYLPSEQSTYPPGKFIQALCEESGCSGLAVQILNF